MVIILLLFLLLSSFIVHIYALVFFLLYKSRNLFNAFFATALTNILVGIILSIFVLKKPELVRSIDMMLVLWGISGFIMLLLLSLKIAIFRNIYKRSKDPAFYHLNYFGKKVYEKGIIKQYEFLTVIISMPFFLMMGAYFVARLINLFLYGHI